MTSTINGPQTQKPGKVEPNEIGWLFVPQYYTFVNKDPARLHMFYTKRSTFIHGTEGEDCTPCHGQQEIHNRIMSLGFDDCKVFVSNVDSQASAEGGILVQVLGEMCNAGGPWKKFAQTFFLAEQPNGYFVLNDVFRYMREEGDEPETITDEVVEQAVPEEEEEPEKPIPENLVETQVPLAIPPAETEDATAAEAEVIPPTEQTIPESSTVQVNGISHHEEEIINTQVEPEPEPEQEPEEEAEEIKPEPEPEVQPTVEQPEEVLPEQPPTPPVETVPVVTPPETNIIAPPPPKADPPPPPKPKTWANLAANNLSKWGSAVADTKGVVSSTPLAPSAPAPKAQTYSHPTSNSPQCFVKGVTDSINEQTLKETLQSRFGPIRSLELQKSRGCAFLEFQTADSANKAREASLKENGIKIGASDTVFVEEKRRREDRGGPWRGDGAKSPGGRGFGSFARQPPSGGFQDGRGGQRGGVGRSRGGR